MAASGSARPRKAAGAAVLVWAMLALASVGCGSGADRGVSPIEDQQGDPKAPWYLRDERMGAEPATPIEPTPAPETPQE